MQGFIILAIIGIEKLIVKKVVGPSGQNDRRTGTQILELLDRTLL